MLEKLLARQKRKRPQDYWIAVVGGSVSNRLASYSSETLIDTLGESEALRDKHIRVLRFARASYKQPQQVVMIAYLLGLGLEPDMVLNIDGFNELVVASANQERGMNPLYPARGHWLSVLGRLPLDRQALDLLLELRSARRRAEGMLQKAERGWMKSCLAGRWILGRLERELTRGSKIQKNLAQRAAGGIGKDERLTGPQLELSPEHPFEALVKAWEQSSISLEAVCKTRSINYVHVLQPALHLPNSKPMSTEEEQAAKRFHEWGQIVVAGYPFLIEAAERLSARGVQIIDTTMAFAQTTETVYYDACHHRKSGCDQLMRYIGGRIVQRLDD